VKAAIFIAKGFEEIEGVNIIDVLRRGGIFVDIISIAGNINVEGSHGISIIASRLYYDVDFSEYDLLLLPGGMPGTDNLFKNEDLCNLLKEFNENKKYIGAICAAPSILGRLGILEGKEATCYPGFEKMLQGAVVVDKDVVVSENIITGKGPFAAIKFALEIIKIFMGQDKSIEVEKGMIVR
jgi:4-methyl-5(b-hydroxyethyl)-thiazole monophosphate biosynthesis